MRPSRFTEEQIIGMLKEQEAGAAMADVCRTHDISSATFYKFKAKHGGMDVSPPTRKLRPAESDDFERARSGACAIMSISRSSAEFIADPTAKPIADSKPGH